MQLLEKYNSGELEIDDIRDDLRVLLQDKERVSLLRLLTEVYGLAPPERLWP